MKLRPWYNKDANYQTNAKSFMDYLARTNKFLEVLIEDYENFQELVIEELERILFDSEKSVDDILVNWLEDGTLARIINDGVLGNKADKTELDKTNAQLTQKKTFLNTVADMKDYEHFKVGDSVQTLGYHREGDMGGGNYFVFTNDMNNTPLDIPLKNNLVAKLIATNEFNIRWYGVKDTSFGNDVDNSDIFYDMIEHLKTIPTGKVLFVNGAFRGILPPLKDLANLTIKGLDYQTNLDTLQYGFIANKPVDYFFQTTDVSSEIGEWRSVGVSLKNLFINCNEMANNGIVGNKDLIIENVTVNNALQDGIVLWGSSYPVSLNRVKSYSNGRHGVYVKAPNSTVYYMNDLRLSYNNGYGLYIEDGNTSDFKNVLCQYNKQGGVKIKLLNRDDFNYPIFLERLKFTSLYTEQNGLLATSHPNYDGNAGVKIEGVTSDNLVHGKIKNVTIENSSINASTVGDVPGVSWDLKGVYGLTTINSTQIELKDSHLFPNRASILNLKQIGESPVLTDIIETNFFRRDINTMQERDIQIYKDSNKLDRVIRVTNGGYLGYRGRVRELEYHLENVPAGSSMLMNTTFEGTQGYTMFQRSTLIKSVGRISKKITSGTITFKLRVGYSSGNSVNTDLSGSESVVISSSDGALIKTIEHPFIKHEVSDVQILGVQVTTSSDFAVDGDFHVYFNLLLES